MSFKFKDNVRETSVTTGTGSFTLQGATAPLSTAVVGVTFDSSYIAGDLFDYVIQHRTANEWEAGRGEYVSGGMFNRTQIYGSSNAGNAVNFSAGTKVVWSGPTSFITKHFADIVNIENYGAIDGADNTTPITLARSDAGVNKPVFAPHGVNDWGIKSITSLDFSFDAAGEGTGFSLSEGTVANPSTVIKPVIYIEKTTVSDGTSNNDHGGLDIRTKKVSGTQNLYGTFLAAEAAGGTGIVTPLLTIVRVTGDVNYATGYRSYVSKAHTMTTGFATGMDVFISDTSGDDAGWQATAVPGTTTGISIANDPGRGQFGIRLFTGTPGNAFYTGALFDQDCILPTSFSTHSEAIRIRGGSDSGHKYAGIWLQDGNLTTGFNFSGPTYDNNCAILMPMDTKTVYGGDPSNGTYTQWKNSGNLFDIEGGSLAVSGTKVVGTRVTGWTAPTGTSTKGGFATGSVDVATLAQSVKAMYDALVAHGLIGT